MKTIKVRQAKRVREKVIGLIGSPIEPLYFDTRFGIHTFGMKQSIDVLILDEQWTIRNIKESLKPNSFYFWNPTYKRVLELPQGYISSHQMKIGNQIQIDVI